MQLTSPSTRPPEVSYLFVDGANFASVIGSLADRYFAGNNPILDWQRLRGSHRKAFFYDAIPVQRPGEDANTYETRVAAKRGELAHIEGQRGFHVRTGEVRRRGSRRGNEQKMVDVQLAVDALLMASRGLFSTVTLITGDLDFAPLISALVEMGVNVDLLYPPDATSRDLLAVADNAEPLRIGRVRSWIDHEFLATRPLPEAGFIFPAQAAISGVPAGEWDDDRYGRCRLTREGGGTLHLLTSVSPRHPNHILELRAQNGETLRHYALDMFELAVPEF